METLVSTPRITTTKQIEEIDRIGSAIAGRLPAIATPQIWDGTDDRPVAWGDFVANRHSRLLEMLIERFDHAFPVPEARSGVVDLFTVEHATFFSETLSVLIENMKTARDRQVRGIVLVVERLLRSNALLDSLVRDDLPAQSLISLPTCLANRLRGAVPKFLTTENIHAIYVVNVVRAIVIGRSTAAISTLLGRVAQHRMESLRRLVPLLEHLARGEVVPAVLRGVPAASVENVCVVLLKNGSGRLRDMLRDVIRRDDWKYILTIKIPLLSSYRHGDLTFITNLARYVVDAGDPGAFLFDLVKAWSSRSAITHTSFEQHLFVTKLIIVLSRMTTTDVRLSREFSRGVMAHLESPNDHVRIVGMVVSEALVAAAKTSDFVLKYDYEDFDAGSKALAKELTDLRPAEFAEAVDFDEACRAMVAEAGLCDWVEATASVETVDVPSRIVAQATTVPITTTIDDVELDSDDDLEPYDMSNDTAHSTKQAPMYLRDLRDNLYDVSDPETFSLSIAAAERLISTQLANDDVSLAIELLEILMTLEPKYPVDDFERVVFGSCVTITSIYPVACAEFLAKHFHAAIGSYTIAQRVFMLDVLSETARNLSQIRPEPRKARIETDVGASESLIRSRLEARTRRYFSATVGTTANRFAPVAGSFFFPLLYGIGSFHAFALAPRYDSDHVLLVSFLKTVCTVTYCARNCPIACRIGKEVLDMIFTIRFHRESKVRLAVIHLVAAVVLTVPKPLLRSELLRELLEARLWLVDLLSCGVDSEANTECRAVAANVLCVLEDAVKIDVV